MLTPPIAWLVETEGLAGATPWLAGLLLAAAIPLALLLPPPRVDPLAPAEAAPDPVPGDAPDPTATPRDGVFFHEAVGSGWFRLVTLAFSLGMLTQLGLLAHLYAAVEIPLGASAAASVVSATAASSLVGRLAASWALTHLRLGTATVWLLAAQGVAVGLLAATDLVPVVAVAAVLFGTTVGNLQAVQPLLLLERFGGRDFARILGAGTSW